MRILVVDDEFVSRKKAHKILSEFGECDFAVNGKEALQFFLLALKEQEPFDLITLDVSMPDMDGVEVLKKLRHFEDQNGVLFGEGVKVLMVTASKDSDTVFKSYEEGCEAYIVKPFNRESIVSALKELRLV